MKKTIKVLCGFVCLLSLIALVLTSCDFLGSLHETPTPNETPGNKQIPVYQGMSITSVSATMPSFEQEGNNGKSKENGSSDNNGNHNGWYKGDSVEDQDEVDQETPFPDADENIEQEIKDSLKVIGSNQEIYYATQNQDIYIHIHIHNPDQFEILSFTLNGQKYSSYMFVEGSTQELLILKLNVGNASGIVKYTIDQIKYIDGTEIKDVMIEGNQTVKAGVRIENQVSATVSALQIGTNSISFNATISDKDDLIAHSQGNIKAVLYDGDTLITEKELSVGSNAVAFDGLKTGTVYQYAIVASYDALDDNGIALHVLDKYALQTNYAVLFDNIVIGQDNISFTFVWDESFTNQSLTGMKLYKDDALVKELNVDVLTVSELLSASEYVLVAEYQNLDKTETISLTFGTLEKGVPGIFITNATSTQTSIDFEISVSDADNVGSITKIELVHANGTVEAENLDVRSFADLLSNNTYTVKVTYTYDLNNGKGEQTVTKELAIITESKIAPSFAVQNESITEGSINAKYRITDVDNILASYKVELYKGTTLVMENAEKEISFASLNYYTDYTLKITYTYNLNDGNGEQTSIFEKTYKTLPFIDVVECNVANTSAVSEGETIFMSIKLNNPLGMTIESVVINGENYSVTGASTKNTIFVEIVNNGQFAGGDTYLKVDKVNAKFKNATFIVEPKTELADNAFINGKLEVLKIEFVNDKFEPIDWAFPSDAVYVMITLNNPTGYCIESINENITDLVKIDNNKWYYQTAIYDYGWHTVSLTELKYYNDHIEKTITYSNMEARCYKVVSEEIHYISAPEDLKNMNDGYYYELKNDIDLSDFEWLGTELDGVFDGMGYAIKNMSFVGTINNADAYLGLFSSGRGVILNLNIKKATIIAEVTEDDNKNYQAYLGGLVARCSGSLSIKNCTVDEYSVYTIKNTVDHAYSGGMVGYTGWVTTITNCINNGNVSASAENYAYSGGIVGHTDGITIITNCTNNGDISAISCSIDYYGEPCAGGIVGEVDHNETIASCISNCINNGNVSVNHLITQDSGEGYAGGIVGYVYDDAIISNCINNGDITATSTYNGGLAGGIVGYIFYTKCTITNCINSGRVEVNARYRSEGGIIAAVFNSETIIFKNCYSTTKRNGYDGDLCTASQLNSKEFYTDTLGWSESIWDFSELDVENGKCPKLK